MIRLRLFHRQDPARQIDSRVLGEGEISIGRGIKADWQIADPERDLSRLHMVLMVRNAMLTVRDISANGVFIGNPRTRLEQDRATPVSRGESIVFGPYLLVAEEDAAAQAPEAPILDDDPFGAPNRADDAPARPRDPFGSALRPDPVKLDEEPGDGVDAWERRREYKAGDWDPVAPHRRPDHSQLIGTPQNWAEPPAPAEREHGMGFDAPFTSPILREPEPASPDTVSIPSDWDAVAPSNPVSTAIPPTVEQPMPQAPFTDREQAARTAPLPVDPFADSPVPIARGRDAAAVPTAPIGPDPFAGDAHRATDAPARGQQADAVTAPIEANPFVDDPIVPPAAGRGLDEAPSPAAPLPADAPAHDPILASPAPIARGDDGAVATSRLAEPPAPPSIPPGRIDAPAPPPVPASTALQAGAPDADVLFESFCAGARLSPNAFAGEDRAQLMERLGAVYRQAILGVADLMSERTALKNDFRMVRTTIRPEGNNPFKWVPPQRIAVELLRSDDGSGYSTGEAALNEALHDVKAHMLCVLAGMRGAIGATFDLLSPSEIEARTANRGFVMPGQRSAAAWSEYVDQYAAQRREADDSAEGPINRAFRQAYEDQLKQLDGQVRGRGR